MSIEIEKRFEHMLAFLPSVASFVLEIQSKVEFSISKKGDIDIVTEADLGAEKRIIEEIQKYFPEDKILGEETGLIGGEGGYKWIIDPVDGTTNFAHRLPLFAIACGLEDTRTEEVVLGIVLTPALGDVYYAKKGSGAFKNGKLITVSGEEKMINSLLCTGFPYNLMQDIEGLGNKFKHFLLKSRGVRRTGSACLDLCWLAEGRFDGFWEQNLKPWDTAAASLIIREAGGKLSDFFGDKFNHYGNTILASNGKIHEDMLSELGKLL
ncbi:MAG: inositol monophosphatase [Leptospiraceae bacterium]|nr:inositol monophosphatase [Leptospiraceae bacterium]MCP5499462.1 inositol monophosphatase [Leptospiraceae bacterium]